MLHRETLVLLHDFPLQAFNGMCSSRSNKTQRVSLVAALKGGKTNLFSCFKQKKNSLDFNA
ncbi:hypothetical protein ACFGW3_05910 [Pasteurella multocida]|uniref:hypothetical protein n=1 Tax=Pasteurella multocida TaxID=747 RepID=UPI002BC88EC3|nr:hypothetical protein [Pasteurella multocida]MEB3504324.1 hypothetical protein [Pasteurella multocida]HDR1055573.1 hypothetical protein [Pasteurella multocida]